ncbi:hypothetical protein ASE27_01875 [Oerskovia sp. Root918]|uniref:hypothetical protein n=1 Tax=Oerskovia sp. Root918 TaxID=1736607 RepID=UPI0006FCF5A6|nr:hypothetical protein [Oerskovia sp. Root918]KRD47170.1 hypothetical protein ASE27_01875 [Oerskovia sp. Root918]
MSTDDRTPGPAPEPRDEAYERVRDADPAATATPDLGAIAAKDETVRAHLSGTFGASGASEAAARAADAGTGVPSSSGGTLHAGGTTADADLPDELAVHRARRRRRFPLTAAAAVAGVLAFGVGGYALGSAGSGTSDSTASTADAPITLQAPATEQGAASSTAADSKMSGLGFGGFGGRTVFTASGLGTDGDSAPAWALDAAGVFSAESAARVAAALGVTGEPRQEYGAWVVGADDGAGPWVTLQPDGQASVSFNDPTKDPWNCVLVDPAVGSDSPSTEEMQVDPQAGCGQADLGKAPAADAAIGAARDVLTSLGVDPAGYELTTDSFDEEGRAVSVTAAQVVEGQRTGLAWNLTYSGAGLSSLYGSLAPTVSIGDYTVVSPTAAVERLGDPRFAGSGMIAYARGGQVGVMMEDSAVAPVEPTEPTVPPTAGEGAAISWPVSDVTITEARLGWAVHYQGDGGAVLVPSYELSDAEGNAWSVVAVTDDELDFAPAG